MLRRFYFPLILGSAGITILVALGVWQLQRLAWKEALLAEIDSRIYAVPELLPVNPSPEHHNFLSVSAEGIPVGRELLVLLSRRGFGPGFRSITAFETEGRRVLLDRGFLPEGLRNQDRANNGIVVVGNLHWPREFDRLFTPEPEENLWFARRVSEMAAELGTEPVLIVSRETNPPVDGVYPWPVNGNDIPNNHLQYAITWFALAVAWIGMTAFWLWRISRSQQS